MAKAPSSGLIPEPHWRYVRQVCALIEADSTSLRDQISERANLSNSYAMRLVEDPSIICIAGERGSGKTTVLATASAELSTAGHLVIPPVRPEYFAAPASLIPSAVAHLQTTIRNDWLPQKAEEDVDASLRIRTTLDRTLRQANLLSYGSSDFSSLRADEQAADRSLAASADSDFIDIWQQLTSEVREMAAKPEGSSPHPLIIIPVDDPDLAPGVLRQILLDLRLLTSMEGVVGIACLDLEEARSVLSDAYSGSYQLPPNRLLAARVVEAQIAKAFPDDRRVTIFGLDGEQRLSFRALDLPLPSLEAICQSHAIGEAYGEETLGSVFRMAGGQPSLYANALPANPRDLRGLAFRLSNVAVDSPYAAGEAALELCNTAVTNGLKQSGAIDETIWPSGLPFEITPPVEGRPSCVLRFDDILVRGVRRGDRSIASIQGPDGSATVTVGYDSGIDATMVTPGAERKTIQRLDASLSYALLMVREFSDYYGVIHCNISGSVPVRGGDRHSRYMRIKFDGKSSDDRFLSPPAWEAFYDYFVLDEALSVLIPVAARPHELSDPRLIVEAYLMDFCRNVVSVQSLRAPADDPARISRGVRERSEEEAQGFLSTELVELFAEFERTLKEQDEAKRDDEVRAGDFKRWIEVAIANVCHDRLVRTEFIEEFLAHRAELLDRRGRATVADAELSAVLEGRIKGALDETWVPQLIDLITYFDSQLGQVLLASHRAAMEAVERGRSRLLGEAAMKPPQSPPESYELDEGDAAGEEAVPTDFEITLAVLERLEAEARALVQRSKL
jgi:hypothetical protein